MPYEGDTPIASRLEEAETDITLCNLQDFIFSLPEGVFRSFPEFLYFQMKPKLKNSDAQNLSSME